MCSNIAYRLTCCFWLFSSCLASLVCADVVELKNGGTLRGEVVRNTELPRSVMAVESPWGPIVIDKREIQKLVTESPSLSEYRRRAPAVSDSVESQLALAMWCRDHGLGDQLRQHLERVIDLDPNHQQARSLLGYQKIDGVWKTRDDLLAARGLIRFDGDFRTQQEIALIERRRTSEEVDLQWRRTLIQWRKQIDSTDPETSRAAVESLSSLNDPMASKQLVRLLLNEKQHGIKLLMIRTAGQIDTRATVQTLARFSLEDNDPEIRASCLEQLELTKLTGITAPFIASLNSKDNVMVNRAADALAVLGTELSLKPLVEALVTTHQFQIGVDTPGDSYSLNTATGQHSFGGGGAKIVKQEIRNPRVLEALISLTNTNFLYDEPTWRNWLASRQVIAQVDLRRDN